MTTESQETQDEVQDASPPTPQRRLMDRVNPHRPDGSCLALDMIEQRLQVRLDKGSERMSTIEADLKKNTSDTSEILDILYLGKSFFRFVGLFGSFVKWSAAIAAPVLVFWYTLKGGGKT